MIDRGPVQLSEAHTLVSLQGGVAQGMLLTNTNTRDIDLMSIEPVFCAETTTSPGCRVG